MFGFSWVCFSEEAPGGNGERQQGMLAPGAAGASPFLWVGKATSSPSPSPALFLGSRPAGQLPPYFPDGMERQMGCNHSKRPQFHQAVLLSLAVLPSFRRSQWPKRMVFDNCLRSSVVICHLMTHVCFLHSPCYHRPDTCPPTMTWSLQVIIEVRG